MFVLNSLCCRKLCSSSFKNLFNIRTKDLRGYSEHSGLSKRQEEIMAKGLPQKKHIKGVKHIVLVSSGKGGVGKSTVAVNTAAALAECNPKMRIALLDADVFGPSIPLMMNLTEKPLITPEKLMIPLVNYGVKCMSMGFLVAQESAMMWRGLMVMQAINKLLFEVDWGPTDILLVDTPPGTGDTHLSLIQNLFISGALVVTTPQQAALQVARRGITMFQKLSIPVIGIVQNMSSLVCTNCNHKNTLFGSSVDKFASELEIQIVQDIPLHSSISTKGDEGQPIVISDSNSPMASAYRDLALKVVKFLKLEEG